MQGLIGSLIGLLSLDRRSLRTAPWKTELRDRLFILSRVDEVKELAILDNSFDELSLKERRERTGSLRLHNGLLAYQAILASSSCSIIILDLTYYYKNDSLSK